MEEENKKVIAVTMATSRQGISVVKALSKSNFFKIRALTRNKYSEKAKQLLKLPNVEVVHGDLVDKKSLIDAFRDSHGIFGNTTPTRTWGMDLDYERLQGKNLIGAVEEVAEENKLKHFIFSSICKAKVPSKLSLTPGHFLTKWEIEEEIIRKGLKSITTVISPVSYFENFYSSIPGITINSNILPGIVSPSTKWQTVAVNDIGPWTLAIFKNQNTFQGKTLDIVGEELSGKEMACILDKVKGLKASSIKYQKLPRIILKFIENDIAIMANWIERYGYGADMLQTKELAKTHGVNITSLEGWLQKIYPIKKASKYIDYLNGPKEEEEEVTINADSI